MQLEKGREHLIICFLVSQLVILGTVSWIQLGYFTYYRIKKKPTPPTQTHTQSKQGHQNQFPTKQLCLAEPLTHNPTDHFPCFTWLSFSGFFSVIRTCPNPGGSLATLPRLLLLWLLYSYCTL